MRGWGHAKNRSRDRWATVCLCVFATDHGAPPARIAPSGMRSAASAVLRITAKRLPRYGGHFIFPSACFDRRPAVSSRAGNGRRGTVCSRAPAIQSRTPTRRPFPGYFGRGIYSALPKRKLTAPIRRQIRGFITSYGSTVYLCKRLPDHSTLSMASIP